MTSGRGLYPHTDAGVEVRCTFHRLRNVAIENFNEHFEAVFGAYEPVPTKGEANTARFASGAVFVYQLAPLYRYEHDLGATTFGSKPSSKPLEQL